ncbi:MAG: PEP-CTERM sorting domain-containing protein [bacterium]|nr:PEP-CTERM sorting domain-containing protein [bacterium]
MSISARSRRVTSAVLLATAFVLVSAGPASAGPFDPTYRGDDNSVHAIFDWVSFGQADWNTSLFETGSSTYALDASNPLATDDGTDTTVLLPNFIDPLPLKLMRIQMGFDGEVSGDLIAIDLLIGDPLPTSWNVVGGSGPGDGHWHYIDVEITPNPDWEEITIFGNSGANLIPGNFLALEIDTVSLPEPASLSLLTLGGLALVRRRRR